MSNDVRTATLESESAGSVPASDGLSLATPLSEDSRLAVEIRRLVKQGCDEEARERFGELVAMHQRRASRIAYQCFRDTSEADEAQNLIRHPGIDAAPPSQGQQ